MGKRSRADDEEAADSGEGAYVGAQSPTKLIEIDDNASGSVLPTRMQCSLPPHRPLSFSSADEFDVHYAKEHTNRCTSCGKNFPSAHYLSLHIDENHNPLREELAAKGEKTYACFVEDCERKCSTPQKRRLHLIDKHMFPKVYNFRIIDQGIDKTSSLLQGGQRRRLSTTTSSGGQRRASLLAAGASASVRADGIPAVEKDTKDDISTPHKHGVESPGVQDLEKSFAALKFVPPSVQAKQSNKKAG